MSELIRASLLWHLVSAVYARWRRTGLSRALTALRRLCMQSAIYRLCAGILCAEPIADRSSFRRMSDAFNARLHKLHGSYTRALQGSALHRLYARMLKLLRGSALLGWLFAGGLTTVLLCMLAAYFPLDYLFRDIIHISALASVWDEGLMVLCLAWILLQRVRAKTPLRSAASSLDVYLLFYLLTGLLLLSFTLSYVGINIAGYRASMQYILVFYLVTRLLHNDRDFYAMYRVMLAFALLFAVHGLYQFAVGAEIPSTWVDQAEGAVRTRVFSIFKNPNIMGAYMLLFAPMAIGAAYAETDTATKVFYWICGLCMCLSCLFTLSRGAWLALAIAAIFFSLIIDRRLLVLMLVGGLAACLVPSVRSRITYLFTPQFVESNERGGRAKRWSTALGYLDDYDAWPAGLGYGCFGGAVAAQNQIRPEFDYLYTDNYYVKILAENGIIGLSAFCTSIVGILWNGIRACGRAKQGSHRPVCVGMLAGLIGILVQSFFENIWEEPYMMAIFFAVAGMLCYFGFRSKSARAEA